MTSGVLLAQLIRRIEALEGRPTSGGEQLQASYLSVKPDGTVAPPIFGGASPGGALTPAFGRASTYLVPTLRDVVSVKDFGAYGDGVHNDTAAIATAIAELGSAGGAELVFPPGFYIGSINITNQPNVVLTGAGANTVIHNPTGGDAISAVGCNWLTIRDLQVEGAPGSRDGVHLENCQLATLARISSGGTGRAMGWAQRCFGISLDDLQFSVTAAPGLALPQAGMVLTWDGSDITSGCNEFVLNGGTFVVGQTPQNSQVLVVGGNVVYCPGWAFQILRADGGTIAGAPVAELSAGGVFMQFCNNVHGSGFYSELNPSDISYETGTITVNNGATAVTGAGTAWTTNPGAPEVPYGFPGKYVVSPVNTAQMAFAKVAALTDDTDLTLAPLTELNTPGWPGPNIAGVSHRLVGCQLFLDNCVDVTFTQMRGGSAILMRSSSRCFLIGTCEELLADAGCVLNAGVITTNRVTNLPNRILDLGVNNLFKQLDYQTNGIVQDNPLPVYNAAQLAGYAPTKQTVVWDATHAMPAFWDGAKWNNAMLMGGEKITEILAGTLTWSGANLASNVLVLTLPGASGDVYAIATATNLTDGTDCVLHCTPNHDGTVNLQGVTRNGHTPPATTTCTFAALLWGQ